jgi:hypothetical protein
VKALAAELAALDLLEQEQRITALTDAALLRRTFGALEGDDVRLLLAQRLYQIAPREGIQALAAIATTGKLEYCRTTALDLLTEAAGVCVHAATPPPEGAPHDSN